MKQFTTAARRGTIAVPNEADLEFEFEVGEGQFVTMTAHAPTTGQIALFLSTQTDGGQMAVVRAMFDLLAAVMSQADYDVIEEQLHQGMDVAVVTDIIQWLIEEWGARPTSSRSASSTSRRTNGARSTGKRPTVVRTTSV